MLFSFLFFPAQFPCCLYEYFHLSGLVIPFYLYFGCSFTRLSYSHLLCFFFVSSLIFSLTTHFFNTLRLHTNPSQIAMAGAKRKLDTAPAPSPSQGASQSTSSNTTSHVFHV